MGTITVLRLENPETHRGPWNDGFTTSLMEEEMMPLIERRDPSWKIQEDRSLGVNGDCHPAPETDPGIGPRFRGGMHLAFRDMDQLKYWFRLPQERHILSHYGQRLVTYEVPEEDAVVGFYQVAFKPARARQLGEPLDPSTIK